MSARDVLYVYVHQKNIFYPPLRLPALVSIRLDIGLDPIPKKELVDELSLNYQHTPFSRKTRARCAPTTRCSVVGIRGASATVRVRGDRTFRANRD